MRIDNLFDNTPHREVNWRQVWRSWRPVDRPPTAQPVTWECPVEPVLDVMGEMWRRPILLKDQVIDVGPVGDPRPDFLLEQLEVGI